MWPSLVPSQARCSNTAAVRVAYRAATYPHQAFCAGWIDDPSGDGSYVFVVVVWGREAFTRLRRASPETRDHLRSSSFWQARIATFMQL